MKSILITTMLVMVVLAIYSAVVAGPTGTKMLITNGGGRINDTIERMDP
ncbi:hypothetical protein ACFFK0_07430 [Paenibacillus chartarius]|uniref:Uncharacterized protein n=1 Tax=Paenibacillus chartarius TaxID=747481 RepID=A0ABV6DI18_9BACL